MSAPLNYTPPAGTDLGALWADTPTIGWRLEGVLATAVRSGHFTTFNGYRRVMSVAEGWVTQGRGRNKRTYLSTISFERADGSINKLDPADELTIYAPDALFG